MKNNLILNEINLEIQNIKNGENKIDCLHNENANSINDGKSILIIILLMVLVFGLLTFGIGFLINRQSEVEEKYIKVIESWYQNGNAILLVKNINVVEEQKGLNPSVIYSGKDSEAIALNNVISYGKKIQFSQSFIVKTKSGSYFRTNFSVVPWLHSGEEFLILPFSNNKGLEKCSQSIIDCGKFEGIEKISDIEAKAEFFHSDLYTRESYFKFFKEEAP